MSENNNVPFKAFIPVIAVFVIVNAFAIVFSGRLASWNVDQSMVIYGNLLLFVVTLCSWFFHRSAINAGNIQVFLRNVYTAMLLKLFVCVITFFFYVYYVGSSFVNKPALFIVMFLYLAYTFIELGILIQYSKKRNSNG